MYGGFTKEVEQDDINCYRVNFKKNKKIHFDVDIYYHSKKIIIGIYDNTEGISVKMNIAIQRNFQNILLESRGLCLEDYSLHYSHYNARL